MRKAIFPGSFDPFTLGHLDILKRSLSLFDEITVGVGRNNEKKTMFSEQQRIGFIKKYFENEPKIKVKSYEGLTIDFCKKIDS
jgi:pantetheine-phosphate adenylyltransferase